MCEHNIILNIFIILGYPREHLQPPDTIGKEDPQGRRTEEGDNDVEDSAI